MSDVDGTSGYNDPYVEALNAARLTKRIAAVTKRAPKPAPVARADGTVLLRGRRKSDRSQRSTDRRSGAQRRAASESQASTAEA